MDITLSVEEEILSQARQVAKAMNKNLNQLVHDYLVQLATMHDAQRDIVELHRLTAKGQGRSNGYHFNREEIYEESASFS
jgi:hypothetical protein